MISRRNLLAATAVAAGSASLLTACGLDQKPAPAASPSGSGGSTAAAPVAFTIYTARDKKLAESVVADFEKKYPEWAGKATILTLGAQEALERVRAEKANPQGDIWWGGTRQQLSRGAADGVLAAAPKAVVEAVPADFRDKDGLWIGEMKLAELFMINTQMMPLESAPKDWDDLVAADMKDKLAIRDVEANDRGAHACLLGRMSGATGAPGGVSLRFVSGAQCSGFVDIVGRLPAAIPLGIRHCVLHKCAVFGALTRP